MYLRSLLLCAPALLTAALPLQARSVDAGAKSFAKESKDVYKKELQRYLEEKKAHEEKHGKTPSPQPTAEENKKRALSQLLQQLTYRGTQRPDCSKPFYIFILMGKDRGADQQLAAEYDYARSMEFLVPFYKQVKKEGRAEVVMLWMGDTASLHNFRSKFGNKFPTAILTPALEQQIPGLRMEILRDYSNAVSVQLLDADGKHMCDVGNAQLITTLMRQTW